MKEPSLTDKEDVAYTSLQKMRELSKIKYYYNAIMLSEYLSDSNSSSEASGWYLRFLSNLSTEYSLCNYVIIGTLFRIRRLLIQ